MAQITAPGTTIRNVGSVAYQAPGRRGDDHHNSNEVASHRAADAFALLDHAGALPGGQPDGHHGRSHAVPLRAMASFRWLLRQCRARAPSMRRSRSRCRTPHRARRRRDLRAGGRPRSQPRRQPSIETVDVRVARGITGDAEVLRLSETGSNSGVFVGYIATASERRRGRLRVAGRAQHQARRHLCRSHRQHRRGRCQRARRPLRSRFRFAHRPPSAALACDSSMCPPVLPPPFTAMTGSAVTQAKW